MGSSISNTSNEGVIKVYLFQHFILFSIWK